MKLGLVIVLMAVLAAQPVLASNPQRSAEAGIATGGSLLNMSPVALAQRLQDIKNVGASWIRVDFSWSVIQPHTPERYDFRYHDRVVIAAERAGLKVMGLLAYTPEWARTSACKAAVDSGERDQQKCIPRDNHEFANFARTVAWRYRLHSIHAWEIWNEPNIVGYWKDVNARGEFVIDPVKYARLATRTGNAIHGVDPHVAVVTGGLSPMFEPAPGRGMRQSDFLKAMLPHLARGGVTAVGIHPYTWPVNPRRVADWNAFYTVDSGKPEYNLQYILGKARRGDLQIWATEYGASTVGEVSPARASRWRRADHVNEDTQAQSIREAVEDWHLKPNVGPIFVYSDQDSYLPTHKNEGGFGLRRKDGSPKPAYGALKNAIAEVQSKH